MLYEDSASEATTTAGKRSILLQTTGTGVLSGAFSNIAGGQTLTTNESQSLWKAFNRVFDMHLRSHVTGK